MTKPYTIGVDVGGTNTDAALLCDSELVALVKVPTNHQNLLSSTMEALHKVLEHHQGKETVRLHLSTTLSTNAIVEGKGDPVKVVAVPGPGVNLHSLDFPFPLRELSGYIDHRGREVTPLNPHEIASLREELDQEEGLALAIVGKFSQRNPSHEQRLQEELSQRYRGFISLGHRLSGRANFPRRIMTAYLNSKIARQQLDFLEVWNKVDRTRIGEVLLLKADGGTMTLQESAERPIESILSGPAASVMGVKALSSCREKNYVIVDIGGTTTDLAVVVQDEVLYERDGATISGYKTLVPAVLSRSLGLGGDSAVTYGEQGIIVGPTRAGLPVCLGGDHLTPTDAAVAMDLVQLGSQERALEAWTRWGESLGIGGLSLARQVIEAFVKQLRQAVDALYEELENTPLHTIREVIHPPQLRPQALVGLGAPAPVFIPALAQDMNLPWEVLPFCSGANAIGAAAAKATVGITLHADTELGRITVPEMGYQGEIPKPLFFTLDKARELAEEKTREQARRLGYDDQGKVYIFEEESFNMVRGFHTVGQIHMVRTQLRPEVEKVRGGEK